VNKLNVGDRVTMALDPSMKGVVVEVLDVPGDDLYMILLDGHTEPVKFSRAVIQ
jgi:hypothetical protein